MKQKLDMLKKLKRKSIVIHSEIVTDDRVILQAIAKDPVLKDLIKFESVSYREHEVSLTGKISNQILAKLYLERL
jgi:hypothetical protein